MIHSRAYPSINYWRLHSKDPLSQKGKEEEKGGSSRQALTLKIEKENTHERTEGYDHGLGASQESLTIMKGKVTDQQLASHDIIMKDKNSNPACL
jgi:hypothetical protein